MRQLAAGRVIHHMIASVGLAGNANAALSRGIPANDESVLCGIDAGKIVSWLKAPGDKVKKGESIVVRAGSWVLSLEPRTACAPLAARCRELLAASGARTVAARSAAAVLLASEVRGCGRLPNWVLCRSWSLTRLTWMWSPLPRASWAPSWCRRWVLAAAVSAPMASAQGCARPCMPVQEPPAPWLRWPGRRCQLAQAAGCSRFSLGAPPCCASGRRCGRGQPHRLHR